MAIDVIETLDGGATQMVRRVPSAGSGEFKLGAQVIVRESQVGVFFRDGKCYDTFGPGRHTLSTLNLSLLGSVSQTECSASRRSRRRCTSSTRRCS